MITVNINGLSVSFPATALMAIHSDWHKDWPSGLQLAPGAIEVDARKHHPGYSPPQLTRWPA